MSGNVKGLLRAAAISIMAVLMLVATMLPWA